MITNFNEHLWIDFDLEIAVFLENLVAWIRFNASKENPDDRNFHDGKYWSYNSYPQFAKLFSGWSTKTMRTIINRCVKNELLIVGNYNKKNYDNTKWYTLTEKAWSYFPLAAQKLYPEPNVSSNTPVEDLDTPAQTGRPPAQTGRPIPEKHNSLGSNINITTSGNNKISSQQVVDAYHATLPESPKIRVIGNELSKQIRSMIKNWSKYQKEGKPFSIDSFVDYLLYIKKHYAWFLKPYTTESGKIKRNNLTNITREKNIVRIVNGEFSAN